ncbi:MAG: dockerin type I domain-containing protein, partial [Rubripirellula sp.]
HGPYSEFWGIPLEPGRSHDVILMRNETQLTLLDRPTSSVIFEIPLKSLLRSQYQFREAHLMLAPEHENRVELRHLSAPNPAFDRSSIDEIELQTSIWAGASGLDQLIVTGRGQEWGDSNSGEIHGFGFFRFSGIGASDRSSYRLHDENGNNLLAQDLTIQNFENISSGRDNGPASYVDYGDRSFRFDSVFPYKFGNYSHLEGGLISSTSIMALDTGNVFEGFGVLDGRFAGAPGSMVLPKGDLGIGNDESAAGFDTHGDLQIADHTVTLHDLNWAALGGLTSLGSSSKPGKLDAPNGLVIDFTDNVVGYGSVLAGTSEDPAVVMNNGWIAGDSEDRHITLAGLVKGVGSLTNVTINGIYSPGFSPALVRNGHVTYADQSTVLVELGGTIAGDQHDRIEHETARLSGTLQVELIDGFSPALGDAFKILTSDLPFVGDFLAEKLPQLPDSLTWIVDKSPTEVVLRIGFQSDGDVRIKRNKDDDLLLIDANGNELPTGDDRIRIVVDPADDFSDDRDWKIKDAELKNGLLIQTVTDGNHELEIQGADWTNFVMRADVSDDGEVTSRDALLIINELGRNSVTDLDTGFLRDPASFASWPGVYYDQTGDGRATSLDALRVINQLGRLDNAETGEAEAVAAPGMIWLPADTWAVEVSGGIIERADFAHAMSVPVRQAAADKFAIPAQHASPGESVGAVTSGDRILRTNNDVVDAVDLLLSDESSWIEGEV